MINITTAALTRAAERSPIDVERSVAAAIPVVCSCPRGNDVVMVVFFVFASKLLPLYTRCPRYVKEVAGEGWQRPL
jgi:hypothetical protein